MEKFLRAFSAPSNWALSEYELFDPEAEPAKTQIRSIIKSLADVYIL